MPTTVEERYEVRCDGANVLLFHVVPDDVVSLLVVTQEEWDRAVAATPPEVSPGTTARRLAEAADQPPASTRSGE